MGKELFYFPLKFYSQSASFRVPEEHTFQSSLPLPSVTALTGLVGAAMGLSFENAMAFREEKSLSFGIHGSNGGFVRDLWKHRKIKDKGVITSVLTRDLLFDFRLDLLVAGEEGTLEEVRRAFLDPCYALTMGTSDDMAKILSVGAIEPAEIVPVVTVENTCLRGDYAGKYEMPLDLRAVPLNTTIRPPRVFLLPTDYSFTEGERRLTNKGPFTFIRHSVKLKEPVNGIEFEQRGIPLL